MHFQLLVPKSMTLDDLELL